MSNTPDVFITVQEVVVPGVRIMGGVAGPRGPAGPDTELALTEHVESTSPHPAYDNIPSLTDIFESELT